MDLKNILNLLKRKSSTADDLRSALDRIDVDAAEEELNALEAQRRSILLDGTDKQLSDIEQAIATATRDLERMYAARTELERRVQAAEQDASEQERRAKYEAAEVKRDAAARRLASEYPQIGKKVQSLLKAIAEADVEIERANSDLPGGAKRLARTETVVRARPAQPKEILSETEVELWAFEATGQPLSEDRQREVKLSSGEPGRGYINGSAIGHFHTGPSYCRKATFIRREFLERKHPEHGAHLWEMDVPGLQARDPAFWRSIKGGLSPSPRSILSTLEKLISAKPRSEGRRERKVELIPVTEQPAAEPETDHEVKADADHEQAEARSA